MIIIRTRILLVSEQNGRAFRPFIYQKNTPNLEEESISKFPKLHCKVLVESRRNFAIIFSMSKRTKKSAVTPFYLLWFSRYKSPKIKAFEIHKKYKYERKFIFVVYSFFLHYTRLVFKISASYLHYSFFGEH